MPQLQMKCSSLSRVRLLVARQAPLSMEFSRHECWRGVLFPSPGIFPTRGSSPGLLHCRQILYHLSHHGGFKCPPPKTRDKLDVCLCDGNAHVEKQGSPPLRWHPGTNRVHGTPRSRGGRTSSPPSTQHTRVSGRAELPSSLQ